MADRPGGVAFRERLSGNRTGTRAQMSCLHPNRRPRRVIQKGKRINATYCPTCRKEARERGMARALIIPLNWPAPRIG